MLIGLIQIFKNGRDYFLEKIYINPSQIIYMQEDKVFKRKLKEGVISLDLNQSCDFTRIRIKMDTYTKEVTVMGNPEIIESKINSLGRKQLLKG